MLFGRSVSLDLGTEGSTGRRFEGFRIQFKVTHTRGGDPSSALIRAYNLSRESIALATQPLALARLFAGYDAPLQIFQGSPVSNGVRVVQQGPDRVLHLELQDGGRVLQSSRVNLSFATGTTLRQAITAVQTALALPPGSIQLGGFADFQLSQGVVLSGTIRDVLDRLCLSLGVKWMVRDGVLHILSRDDTSGEVGPVFSPTSGNLIGAPESTDEGVRVTALLQPDLRPGMPFRISGAESSNGDFNCTRVDHTGDSGWERDFYTIAEGRPRVA